MLALVAADVAIGVVVEYQRDDADLVLHRRREFLHAEHEAAVAGDGDDRLVRIGDLDAERGREAGAERTLVARRDEGARLVDRKAVPGSETDLRQLVDDDRIRRQHLTQDLQIRQLRLDLLDLLEAPPR